MLKGKQKKLSVKEVHAMAALTHCSPRSDYTSVYGCGAISAMKTARGNCPHDTTASLYNYPILFLSLLSLFREFTFDNLSGRSDAGEQCLPFSSASSLFVATHRRRVCLTLPYC